MSLSIVPMIGMFIVKEDQNVYQPIFTANEKYPKAAIVKSYMDRFKGGH